MKIGFIGAGKVGTSLGLYFHSKGIEIAGYFSKSKSSAFEAAEVTSSKAFTDLGELVESSSLILISAPDDTISEIWQNLCKLPLVGKVICHTSGSLSSKVFTDIERLGAYGCSLHPMFAFSDKSSCYKDLKEAYFSLEGDAKYLYTLKDFINSLGNKVILLNTEKKPLYHLANVTVSNLVLSLISIGLEYMIQCGLNENDALTALTPLIENNIRNITQKGTVNSLTGPVERCDIETLKKHLSVIPEEHAVLYSILSVQLANLSQQKHTERDYSILKEYLGGKLNEKHRLDL